MSAGKPRAYARVESGVTCVVEQTSEGRFWKPPRDSRFRWLILLGLASCTPARNEIRVDEGVKWYRLSPSQSIAVWHDQETHVTCYVAEYFMAGIALQCLPDFQPMRLPPTLPICTEEQSA